MISEGSCDTEDWSDDAENSASHHRNVILQFYNTNILQYKKDILSRNHISQYYCIYCIFDKTKCYLGEHKTPF